MPPYRSLKTPQTRHPSAYMAGAPFISERAKIDRLINPLGDALAETG